MKLYLLSAIAVMLLAAGCSESQPASGFESYPAPKPGEPAPDFTKTDTAGQRVTLSQYRGKVVLLDFWATWCGPCIVAMPDLMDRWERFRNRDFIILGVSLDSDPSQWRGFIRTNNIDWVNVLDTNPNAISRRYNVGGIPMTYLIGRDGKIIAAANYIENIDELIEDALEE